MKINKRMIIVGACFASFIGIQAKEIPHTVFLTRFSKFGILIPARGISSAGAYGQNNQMSIGPWEGSFKPGRFHKRNQDTFRLSDSSGNQPIYNEIEWFEVDPETMKEIRHCYVVLKKNVEYSSNIYISSNCRVNIQEARPEGWTQSLPIRTGTRAEVMSTNAELPGTPPGDPSDPGMLQFRARTGITGNDY